MCSHGRLAIASLLYPFCSDNSEVMRCFVARVHCSLICIWSSPEWSWSISAPLPLGPVKWGADRVDWHSIDGLLLSNRPSASIGYTVSFLEFFVREDPMLSFKESIFYILRLWWTTYRRSSCHTYIKTKKNVLEFLSVLGVIIMGAVRILIIFQERPMFSHINGKLSARPFESCGWTLVYVIK